MDSELLFPAMDEPQPGARRLGLRRKPSLPTAQPVREIAVEAIETNGRPEAERSKVTDLEVSIRERGLLQPIVVMDLGHGKFRLLAGARRVLAFRNLGRSAIAATVVAESLSSSNQMYVELIENLHRRQLAARLRRNELIRFRDAIGSVREAARLLGMHENSYHRAISERPRTDLASQRAKRVDLGPLRDVAVKFWELSERDRKQVIRAAKKILAVADVGPVTIEESIHG